MSNCREINMGEIVFDTFITRDVSSFRDRDYYREMEKEITKDAESLRERRSERGRRRKLHFHRGYPLPNMHIVLVHEIVSPQQRMHAARTNIRISRTYRIFPYLRLKNLYSISFFLFPNPSIWTNFDEVENIFQREEFVKVVDS